MRASDGYDHVLYILSGVGIYSADGSSFALKFNKGKVFTCKGIFHKNKYVYRIYPHNVNVTSHRIYRALYDDENLIIPETHAEFEILQHMANITSRKKRQAQLYEIELLIVVDYALFTQAAATIGIKETDVIARTSEVVEDIIHQFAIIVNSIDARFRGIRGANYVINVLIAGIYIALNQSSSPWSESVTESSDPRAVVSEKAVKLFSNWVKVHQHNLPEFDHAMAFTAYNLRKEGNHKTLGLGYTQSMCTDRRFSIVEHHRDIAYVSYIATHELAHSLGAKHDGYPATVMYGDVEKTCQADEGYIMCPKASQDPEAHQKRWRFSDCSVLYFDFFLDYLNENKTNCLTQRSSWYGGQDSVLFIDTESRAYSPDEQCERRHGAGSVLDRKEISKNTSSICHRIPCTNPDGKDSLISTLPLEGTICGHNKVCHYGQCVDGDQRMRNTKEPQDDGCIFGNHPGLIGETGLTCQELLGAPKFAYKCYTYAKECCDTCSWYRRRLSVVEQTCMYGDKKESCSRADCDTDLCCETCAIHSGKLKKCPLLNAPLQGFVSFNTDTNSYGTVAKFSCQSGYHVTGNRTAKCLHDGFWDSTVPTCIEGCLVSELPPQTYIENGHKEDVFKIGSHVKIICHNGFELDGDDVLECKNDSFWSSAIPKCILAFTSPEVISVRENLPSAAIVHQLTTGNVSSAYRLLFYSTSGFKVTKDGAVLVDDGYEIDYENVKKYYLIVEATSSVDKRFKVRQRLEIIVQDVNEFKPSFPLQEYCIFLEEPYTKGMVVFKHSATDRDASGSNISYHIRNVETEIADIFRIDTETGIIEVANADLLGFLDSNIYTLQIEAVDTGSPQLTGTCVVQVRTGLHCPQNGAKSSFVITSEIFLTILYICIYNIFVFYLLFKRR
ncbi:uncharacterized protein LOC132721593 [Ruditapes philippinarum]|uniref:uncharacterized protein LOC132721593 n=1 Tax=Ruditapes philippinarum TaxID=129788 RepID=UPI00295B3041|nr:uncharacterized protein LOC132721593 [Ruditapes philippinarum]